jgi:hypothetical protein
MNLTQHINKTELSSKKMSSIIVAIQRLETVARKRASCYLTLLASLGMTSRIGSILAQPKAVCCKTKGSAAAMLNNSNMQYKNVLFSHSEQTKNENRTLLKNGTVM